MATHNVTPIPIPPGTPIPVQQAKRIPTARPLTLEEVRNGQPIIELTDADIDNSEEVNPLDPDRSKWIVVTNASSHINKFRYLADKHQLWVEFQEDPKTGLKAMGYYTGISLEDYIRYKESISFGSSLYHNLRNHFPWVRVNYSVGGKRKKN